MDIDKFLGEISSEGLEMSPQWEELSKLCVSFTPGMKAIVHEDDIRSINKWVRPKLAEGQHALHASRQNIVRP